MVEGLLRALASWTSFPTGLHGGDINLRELLQVTDILSLEPLPVQPNHESPRANNLNMIKPGSATVSDDEFELVPETAPEYIPDSVYYCEDVILLVSFAMR
jgi:hypothetical protein